MAKRSISKIFYEETTTSEIAKWLSKELPLISSKLKFLGVRHLTQKITITINLDPDKRGSLIPEGPKISHKSNGSARR